jgi:2-hydroxychromene-2-carboxylate isomerase
MADLEFFFDPVCPWAWITSRWVTEVQQLRDYDIQWRFISLRIVNENLVADWYDDKYKAGHRAGSHGLRVADEVRLRHDNAAVAALYTALGTAIHVDKRRDELVADPVGFMKEMLAAADLPTTHAAAALDESHDAYLREETELALSRTGRDVGTPILTFHPGLADEGSFFGPVISTIPRDAEATRLWDAVEVIATTSGMAELKRSNRAKPVFT